MVSENIKVWKGEPFERAMANFYLGLVYYMRHDYQNARAAFENSLFKLRDYGEGDDKADAYRDVESNFALGYLMLGQVLAAARRRGQGRRNFDRATELQPYLAPLADPRLNARSNLLLVVDFSRGPGQAHQPGRRVRRLRPAAPARWRRSRSRSWSLDGRRADLDGFNRPTVDLLALAQDRRWEDIDTIRAVKTTLGTGLLGGRRLRELPAQPQRPGRRPGPAGRRPAAQGAPARPTSASGRCCRGRCSSCRCGSSPGTHDVTVEFPGLRAAPDLARPDRPGRGRGHLLFPHAALQPRPLHLAAAGLGRTVSDRARSPSRGIGRIASGCPAERKAGKGAGLSGYCLFSLRPLLRVRNILGSCLTLPIHLRYNPITKQNPYRQAGRFTEWLAPFAQVHRLHVNRCREGQGGFSGIHSHSCGY